MLGIGTFSLNRRYNFSLQLSLPNRPEKVVVGQLLGNLEISLRATGGAIHRIQKHLIEGLPKTRLVPKEFFESCYVKLVKAGVAHKIYFSLPLKGGGQIHPVAAKKSEIENLQGQLKHVIINIQEKIDIIKKNCNIPQVDETPWNNAWASFNSELNYIIAISSINDEEKRECVLNNIEKRVTFSKEKRACWSRHKFTLAQAIVCITQTMYLIKEDIALGQKIQADIEIACDAFRHLVDEAQFAIYLFQLAQLAVGIPVTPFEQMPNNLTECLDWFNNIQILAQQMSTAEQEVNKRIIQSEEETAYLENLFIALKTNKLQLHCIRNINFSDLQQVLGNERSVGLIGGNNSHAFLDI